jgi:hypothetical protein
MVTIIAIGDRFLHQAGEPPSPWLIKYAIFFVIYFIPGVAGAWIALSITRRIEAIFVR